MNLQDAFLIGSSQVQTATTTSTAYALTGGSCVLVTNEGATGMVRVAFGGPTATATANSTSIPPGATRTFSIRDGSAFIAIKTDSATNAVCITTGEGQAT